MALTYNGTRPSKITYQGNDVKKVVYNGVTVWERGTATYKYANGPSGSEDQMWLKGTNGQGTKSELWTITTSIPAGATIVSAKLSLRQGHIYTAPGYVECYWGTSANGTRIWQSPRYGDGLVGNVYEKPEHIADFTSLYTGGTINLFFRRTIQGTVSTNGCNVVIAPITVTIEYIV